jgi:class 3 adenylate cyclase/tetratricopeptide (TPR) repeat protein
MPACAQCGEDNPAHARFCLACGTALGGAARPHSGAERKVVTVLFVDLVGFTGRAERLDPEDVSRVVGPYYARVRSELERFGGTVEKFIGDAVMALFGAPTAHEDDAERAILAAFAIRQAIDEMNTVDPELDLQVRIGVNTGVALVDLGADSARGEALATGDVVNTAARLQQNAPVAGIVVGEPTRRATAEVVEWREMDPIAAKGKHEPVRAWQAVALSALRDPGAAAAPFVGRDEELRVLLDVVRAPPKFVTLVGAPGVGKSRLVWELAHALDAVGDPFLWRQGRCLPYGAGVAYWALGEIVKSQARILETDGAETAGRKLHETVTRTISGEDEAVWVEGHLRRLVGLETREQLGADSRAESFSAWRRFLEALAEERVLVLVLEDLHWADEGLLDFVEQLAGWTTGVPLAVICTSRPELLERRPDWPEVVRLEPLSRDDTATLLGVLVEGGSLGEDVWSRVLDRAAGNPLYAVEYARMLSGRPLEGGELPLPESLQAIVAARLDALPSESKQLLQDAAVVGRGFWTGALVVMSGRSHDEVEQELADLRRREFIRPHARTQVAGESQYAFSHVLIRDVTYEQIPHARRVERHRLAAEWIESLAPDRAHLAEMLAHHYTSAIEYARLSRQDTAPLTERARLVLRDAGNRAFSLYSFAAAERFYQGALDLWPPDDSERPQLLLRHGRALFWAESGGDETLAQAHDALLEAGDREGAAEVDIMCSRLSLARGDRDAVELARQAAAGLEDRPPSPTKAEALSNLARFLELAGNAEEAIAVGRRALELADQLGLDELRADAMYVTGLARAALGDEDGIQDVERSIEITDSLNSPWSVRGYANLASLLANVGDLERAWTLYARARELAERFADVRGLRWLALEQVYEHYWRCDWDDALTIAEPFLADADTGGEQYMNEGCWHIRAAISLARGDTAGALDDSERALEFARKLEHPQALYPSLALRARVALAAGSREEAAALADELLELWASGDFKLASYWTADLAVALSDLGQGVVLLESARRATVTTRWLDAACRFCDQDLVRAADIYAEIGAHPEEAFARLRAVEVLRRGTDGEGTRLQLERALDLYRQAGAEAMLKVGEALAAAST